METAFDASQPDTLGTFVTRLLKADFMPHGHCYFWKPELVWLQVLSNAGIALAYFAIPVMLYSFVRRRKDVPFHWMFHLFAGFIFWCGVTHVMDVVTLWEPIYRLDTVFRLVTAGISIGTAFFLFPLIPQALSLKSPRELEAKNRELELALESLRVESGKRETAEAELRRVTDERARREIERAEAGLKESEERFETLANNIAQLTWMTDEKGWIFWYNQRWFEYTGTTLEEMQGWGWMKVHHPDHLDRVVAKFKRHVESGEPWEDTFPLKSRTGEWRWFLSRARPIKDESGKVKRWFGSNTDIHEMKLLQEELKRTEAQLVLRAEQLARSNADLEQFAWIASHDLKEPMRNVSNYVQLLAKRYQNQLDEGAQQYIKLASDGAKRMHALVDDLLAYARSARHDVPMAPVSASDIVAQAWASLSAKVRESGATIETGALPEIHGNATQLQSLFQNLIANALTYHRDGIRPRVEIGAEPSGDDWRFFVRDNGIGIEREYFDRIFVVFQRLHGQEKYSGTGIGLALAKRIVLNHGGRIWVESQPGEGTTFWFTLPRGGAAAARPARPEASA